LNWDRSAPPPLLLCSFLPRTLRTNSPALQDAIRAGVLDCRDAKEAVPIKLVATLAIIFAGLAGRSAVDKTLTLRGGAELVAFWAQLGSVVELVAGVALAGVGTGISVLVAQAGGPDRQRELLRESLRLGLAVSAPAMFAVATAAFAFPEALAGGFSHSLIVLAAAAGCVTVIPGMLNGYWLGQQRRDLMLALALGSAAVQLAVALAAPQRQVLALLALAQALPALAIVFVFRPARRKPSPDEVHDRRLLRRYILPGLVIGVLTPLAMVAARGIVSIEMSWHEVGLLQALWRVSDWVASVAAGVMAVHFLPRLAAAYRTPQFAVELRRAALATILPSAIALAALGVFQRPVFALLYDESFRMSDAAAALFFAGSLVRIASWLPLYALYVMRRTGPLVIGEFLSMPLFAVLLAAYPRPLTLEAAGVLWLASYFAYGLFNVWAVRRAS
jgi:PST family polysaccharide transporter